ncbi:hypothetical protein PspTeo4_10392 [Pseudomonas sp. Teo4]|nr:hypothetical protein [Pseudomonas sp. Teo4]
MRYILQDAADRLGFVDCDIVDVPWHRLEPGHVIALVAALRADGYAPNSSSLYVNAVRGVMNEAWRQGLIDHERLLRIREVKPDSGSRFATGAQPAPQPDPRTDGRVRGRPASPGRA